MARGIDEAGGVRLSTLALDLATVTGWALHSTGMERPFFGSIALPGDTGEACLALWNFLLDQDRMHQITHLCMEAQHVAMTQKRGEDRRQINPATLYKLSCLSGTVEMFAAAKRQAAGYSQHPMCFKAHIGSWRKHFLGRGNLPKALAKQEAIRVCEAFGWDTFDHNAAEACGILDFFLSLMPGPERPWRDATFMGQRACLFD